MDTPRVIIVGGTGFYGRYLVADVLRYTAADVLVVARHPPRPAFADPRVSVATADHADTATLERLLAGAAVVVHCAGPYQAMPGRPMPLGPLRAAIAAGVPYVDLAEDGQFRAAALAAACDAAVPVLTGASVVPGLQAIAVRELTEDLDEVAEIRCAAAPDTRRHRGPAMFAAMLHGLGTPYTAPRVGRPTRVYGWSEPEWVAFPPPVGRRLVHQVYEMADLAVLGELCDAGTISFKAGTEHAWLNRLLGRAAAVRAATGRPRRPERLTPLVRGLSWLVGRLGNESGGFLVDVTGARAGRPVRRAVGLTAGRDGGRIPSLLAGVAVGELLAGRLVAHGPVPPHGWLPADRAWEALAARGVTVWREDGSGWRPVAQPS